MYTKICTRLKVKSDQGCPNTWANFWPAIICRSLSLWGHSIHEQHRQNVSEMSRAWQKADRIRTELRARRKGAWIPVSNCPPYRRISDELDCDGTVNEWMIQCMTMKSTEVMSIRSLHCTCGVSHSIKISSRVSESKWFVGDHFDPVLTSFKYDFQKALGEKVLPS